jgi:hypothetical protein
VLVQVELVTLVVVDVLVTQPPGPQASQQLGRLPAQALPPFGALQPAALLLIEHFLLPLRSVRQHVAKPGFPQVDCDAQRLTRPAHAWFTSVAFAWPAAQLT